MGSHSDYKSDKPRSLTVTGYAEFTNNSHYEQDQVNLQYSLFISRTYFEKNRVMQQIHGNLDAYPEGVLMDGKKVLERFFGMAKSEVDSCCGAKADFFGAYHDYRDPQGVAEGKLSGAMNYNQNSCGGLATVLELAPGETKKVIFLLGEKYSAEAAEIIARYDVEEEIVQKELDELRSYWEKYLSALS